MSLLDSDASLSLYQGLVRRLASQLMRTLAANVELDDLIQAGMLGLHDALKRFDTDQGVQFETFATRRIRGAMLDYLRSTDHVPRSVRRRQRDIEEAIRALQQSFGREPVEREIAEELGMPLHEYQEMLGRIKRTQLASIEDMGSDFIDRRTNAGKDFDPLVLLSDQRRRQAVIEAIEELPEREQQVMSMRHERDMSLEQIGAALQVTDSRVCQLYNQSIVRLRARLREH